MSDAPTAHIDLKARTAAFKMQISSVKRMLVGLRNTMSKVSKHARRMLVLGGAAVAGLLVLAGKQADAEAKLEAVLKATGHAAGYTAKQMYAMAAAFQKVTRYGDETIMAAQAILATFKEIKGPIFERALESMLDMATVLGQDLKQGAIQLGKALNDPILGVTALSRVGIQFTETQREQIGVLVKSGQVMKAQVIILKELEGQMGGAARRDAETFTGRIVQLKNSLGDLGEQIGFAFVPDITKLVASLRSAIPPIVDWVNANKELIVSTAKWVAGIAAAIVILQGLSGALITAYVGAIALGSAPVVAALAALAAGLSLVGFQAVKAKAALRAMEAEADRYFNLIREFKKAKRAFEEAETPMEKTSALRDQAMALEQLIEIEKRRARTALEAAREIKDRPGPYGEKRTQAVGELFRESEKAARAAELLENKLNMVNVALEKQGEAFKPEAEAIDETSEKTKKFVDQLELERDMLGKTGMEADLLRANIKKLSDTERTLVEGIYSEIDAWEAAQEAEQRAYDMSKKEADSRISSLDRQLALLNKIAVLAGERTEEATWRDELLALGATNAEIEKEIALRKELHAAEETERKKKEGERQRDFKASFVSLTGLHRAIQTAAAGGRGGAAAHAANTAQATKGTETNTAVVKRNTGESKTILQRILDEIVAVKEQLPLVGAFG